ncbi:MAG: hypothetical protein OHK0013_48220 [Sandaracinaceae bacterium]
MYSGRMTRCFLFALALSCVACSQTPSDPDTGAGGSDAVVAEDTFAAQDAPAPADAFVAEDALASSDAPSTDDAFVPADAPTLPDPDAGFEGDAGAIGAGECDPAACTPTCFRAITCVKACGGPVTECGCCACAPGSFDAIAC